MELSVNRTVAAVVTFLVLSLGLAATSLAGQDDTINTTVTPVFIAIDIYESGPLAYGNVSLGDTGVSPNPSNFTVINTGTSSVDLQIRGFNSNGGWLLKNSAGADQYVHYYGINAAGPFSPMGLTPETFKQNLSSAQNQNQQSVWLRLDMPHSTNNFTQHTMPVMVSAILAQ